MTNLNWLVSVDDHVLEPPDLWQSRVAAKYRDRAPRLVRDGAQEYWMYEDRKIPTLGLSAVAGRTREEFSPYPVTYDEMRQGCYDPVARLADMDRSGVLASACFPSVPRFCGQLFHEGADKDLGLACVRAYNDFMIDEWCGTQPGRYIPLIIIPLWDPVLATAEMERCAARGVHAFCFSENPGPLGLPTLHDKEGYWDPIWTTANDTEMVVCIHTGSSSRLLKTSDDAPQLTAGAWGAAANTSGCLVDWLFSGLLQRYSNLKVALSEGNIGWIPYTLERSQQCIDKNRFWSSKSDFRWDLMTGEIKPVGTGSTIDWENFNVYDLFRDHIYGCFLEDYHGLRNVDILGVDNLMVETDYPHADSTWPDCIVSARKQLAGHSDEDTYKMLRGNAERLFKFTPADPPTEVPPSLRDWESSQRQAALAE